jgi:hypothetical protein
MQLTRTTWVSIMSIDSRCALTSSDGYSNDNGFTPALTEQDTIDFMKKQADYSHSLGLSIGLKNAEQVIDQVGDYIEFAVNEQCVELDDCATYLNFLDSSKPVFHIEYPKNYQREEAKDCLKSDPNGTKFSTVLKNLALDSYVYYCDGSQWRTSTSDGDGDGDGDDNSDNSNDSDDSDKKA